MTDRPALGGWSPEAKPLLCNSCRWSEIEPVARRVRDSAICQHENAPQPLFTMSIVTGQQFRKYARQRPCHEVRANPDLCGPTAKWWEQGISVRTAELLSDLKGPDGESLL